MNRRPAYFNENEYSRLQNILNRNKPQQPQQRMPQQHVQQQGPQYSRQTMPPQQRQQMPQQRMPQQQPRMTPQQQQHLQRQQMMMNQQQQRGPRQHQQPRMPQQFQQNNRSPQDEQNRENFTVPQRGDPRQQQMNSGPMPVPTDCPQPLCSYDSLYGNNGVGLGTLGLGCDGRKLPKSNIQFNE